MQQRNTATQVFICLLLLIQLLVPQILCNDETPQKGFTLTPNLDARKATVALDDIFCEFRFSTVACTDLNKQKILAPQQVPTGEKKSHKEMLDRIKGECFSKMQNYWTFKICVGDKVTQFHDADSYTLGHYNPTGDTSDKQEYNLGQMCSANGNDFARKTRVRFMCGTSSALVSLEEPQMCTYDALVVHPQLCGDASPFETYAGNPESNSARPTPIDDQWFIGIEKSADGQYICTAKSILRDLKDEQATCFSKFSLHLLDANNRLKRLTTIFARHSKRKFFAADELQVKEKNMVVQSSSKFDGTLEYVRISATK